jgi:hypothetical protein
MEIKMLKEIFANSLISALCLVVLVVIFEIIFFFAKIKKDIESNSVRLINKIPNLPIVNGISINEIQNIDTINNYQEILNNLIIDNKEKLKNERIKRASILFIIVIIFTIFTIIIGILLSNLIDFKKLIVFVILTFFITIIFEMILYFNVFSKVKTTNDDSLIVELYNQLEK